jgi:PBP1b-binding outer membrane lipoprotein LpoB
MRTQKQVSSLGVIVALFILVLTGCSETQKETSAEKTQTDQAEKAKPMAQAQEIPQIFEGELMKVDTTAKTLSIKSSEGKEMEFRYNDQTLISGANGGVEGLATQGGTPVSVHFDTATRTATKIEVRQRQE